MKFAEPFATIEQLVKIAKQGIEELGAEEFAKSTLRHNLEQNKATKKSLDGSFEGISHSIICMKWWA